MLQHQQVQPSQLRGQYPCRAQPNPLSAKFDTEHQPCLCRLEVQVQLHIQDVFAVLLSVNRHRRINIKQKECFSWTGKLLPPKCTQVTEPSLDLSFKFSNFTFINKILCNIQLLFLSLISDQHKNPSRATISPRTPLRVLGHDSDSNNYRNKNK